MIYRKFVKRADPKSSHYTVNFFSFGMFSHFSYIRFWVIPWTIAHQTSLSLGFSRQEDCNGMPCPSPGDLSNPGMEPATPESLGLQAASLLSEPLKKPISYDESVSCSVMFNFLQLHGSSQPRDWTQVFHIAGTQSIFLNEQMAAFPKMIIPNVGKDGSKCPV